MKLIGGQINDAALVHNSQPHASRSYLEVLDPLSLSFAQAHDLVLYLSPLGFLFFCTILVLLSF